MPTIGEETVWTEISIDGLGLKNFQKGPDTMNMTRVFQLDARALDQVIKRGINSSSHSFVLSLPTPDGKYKRFKFFDSNTMSPSLARKYPIIRAFSGRSLDDDAVSVQLELTSQGLSAQVLRAGNRWMLEPLEEPFKDRVAVYYARDANPRADRFRCSVSDAHERRKIVKKKNKARKMSRKALNIAPRARSRGEQLRIYRLAVATTGEYGAFHGGTKEQALSAVVKTINRINGIFNRELSVEFELIDDNDLIIFTDPNLDPFEGNNDTDLLIDESQSVITENIGSSNFDLGHTFGTGGGGLASTGPCEDDYKASGVTGLDNPQGDAFDVDLVAHEIGHQLGMSHTFNSNSGKCLRNRWASAAFEPGAGTTIMGYAGLCGADDITNDSDVMFHSYSFEEAESVVWLGSGSQCGVVAEQVNSPPTTDAGQDVFVPARTPIVIEGSGLDSDGDDLTYSWEQRDLGAAAALAAADDGTIPLFRVYPPQYSVRRYLPKLAKVVSGDFDVYEKIPSKSRTMNMVLTSRDERGGVASDSVKIEVIGPPLTGRTFSLAEPNVGEEILGSVGTVRWNVGETDLDPISANQVELFLSTDSGMTFPDVPFATTSNDGYARVSFPPGVETSAARIMLKAKNNIFYDVTDSDFSLNSEATETPEVPAPTSLGYAKTDSGIAISFESPANANVDSYEAECVAELATAAFQGSASSGAAFSSESPVVSSISLVESGLVSRDGIHVFVDISHSYRGDVILNLISPSGANFQFKSENYNDGAANVSETFIIKAFSGESISGVWKLEVSDAFEEDEDGILRGWSLAGEMIEPPRVISGSASPGSIIEYGNPVTSKIALLADGQVSPDELEVIVDITHSYRGDVILNLTSPTGMTINLKEGSDTDNANDVKGSYPKTLLPNDPLSKLAGERLAGTWELTVTDEYRGDDGILNSWGIRQNQFRFTGTGTTSPIAVTGLADNTTYICSITGIYEGIIPFRKSETQIVGKIRLEQEASFGGTGVVIFQKILRTVLGLVYPSDHTTSEEGTANEVLAGLASEKSTKNHSSAGTNSVHPIPVISPALLVLLIGLMALLGAIFSIQKAPRKSDV